MQDSDRYYRSSGTVPLAGLAMMFGAGVIAAAVLSLAYSAVDFYSPDVRLNFLATGGYCAALGGVMRWSAKVGAVRSDFLARLMSVGVGMIGVYFAWVTFLWIYFGWDLNGIILDARDLWNVMTALGANGIWEFENTQPKGWALYGLWIVEALFIVLTPVAMVVSNRAPYCEGCRCWTTAPAERVFVRNTDQAELKQQLEEEKYAALAGLVDNIDRTDCLQLTLNQCPKCEDSDYLTVAHVAVTQKGNETRVKTTEFVKRLHIPREVAEQIQSIPAQQKPDFGLPQQRPELPPTPG